MLGTTIRYRSFIWRRAVSDLRHRYAGTTLGPVWNVLHPVALIALYSIVFSQLMRVSLAEDLGARGSELGAMGYVLYLCCGIVPWLAFSECVARGCGSLVANAGYLRKLPVPESVFVAETAVATTMTLAIGFSIVVVIAAASGADPSPRWLLLPLPLLALMALGYGIALLLAAVNVLVRDVAQWVAVGLQAALWTAPIIYPVAILPDSIEALMPFHPIQPSLEAIRELLLRDAMPAGWMWLGMAAWPALIVPSAGLVLRALQTEIRDAV